MNERSSTGSDVFNARDLAAKEIAESFVAPATFQRILRRAHCILEGPRGSGKTTLLRMLTPEAFALWRQRVAGPSLDFIGVFVPADVRWYKQLALRMERIGGALAKDMLQQSIFSVAVSLALVDTLARSAELVPSHGAAHPDLFPRVDRHLEAEIVKSLAHMWSLSVPVPSFNGLRLALRKRQHELSVVATLLAEGSAAIDLAGQYAYINSTWLENLTTAVDTINDLLARPDQFWGILLDELEIVPTSLLKSIVDALRSTDNKVRFKLALSPTGTDLIPHAELASAAAYEDYRPVRLWYRTKSEAREFASSLFIDRLSQHFGRHLDESDLVTLLGSSWSSGLDELEEGEEGEEDVPPNSPTSNASGGALRTVRAGAFTSLYKKDESFRDMLDEKKIDPANPATKDSSPAGILVRKITQIVVHRDRILDSYTRARGAKRRGGQQNYNVYSGYPNIVDLAEGNPRWILTLADALIAGSTETGHTMDTASVQSPAIKDFVQQMVAKLRVYPIRSASAGRRWTPYDFINALGSAIASSMFQGEFKADPHMSFTIDENALEQFGEYVRTAIDLGALVIVTKQTPAALSGASDSPSLVGTRVRLTYRVAPQFGLPLLFIKPQSMTKALSSGELLGTQDRSRTVATVAPSAEPERLPVQGKLL